MGRYGVGNTVTGLVKSVQTYSASGGNGGSTTEVNVTISSVDHTKCVIIDNSSTATTYGAEANDQDQFSSGADTEMGLQLTSSTNLKARITDIDRPVVYGRGSATLKGFIVEYDF